MYVYIGARLGYHPLQTVLQARNTVNSHINQWFWNMYRAIFSGFFLEILILPIGKIGPRKGIPSIQNYWFEVPHQTINYIHTHPVTMSPVLSRQGMFDHIPNYCATGLETVTLLKPMTEEISRSYLHLYTVSVCMCVSTYVYIYIWLHSTHIYILCIDNYTHRHMYIWL